MRRKFLLSQHVLQKQHNSRSHSKTLKYRGTFMKVKLDTGAARGSSNSYEQFAVYCKMMRRSLDISPNLAEILRFVIDKKKSMGIARIDVPVG